MEVGNVKELNELVFLEGLRYTEDHEWISTEGETLKVGVSDYAQDQMGDIVYVEMPDVGDGFEKGEEFGTLESVKAVSELYLPVSGEVIAVNEELVDTPEAINEDPYENWIVEIRPTDPDELEELLTAEDYQDLLKG